MRTSRFPVVLLVTLAACHRAEPPGAAPTARASSGPIVAAANENDRRELQASASAGANAIGSANVTGSGGGAGSGGVPNANALAGGAGGGSAGGDSAGDPPLLDDQGHPLPQTEDRPSLNSPSFQRRIQLVAEAIRSGDAEGAKAAFFPLVAYQAVKDVQKPERDFRFRLLANFARDVKDYHKELGRDAAQAQFLGVDVREAAAKWMTPGSEGNRLGYYRVLRSRLRFKLANGSERKLELTSLISWRGEWYVVHLHGFE